MPFPCRPNSRKQAAPGPTTVAEKSGRRPSFPRRNREVPVLEGGKGENQSSSRVMKGCEETSHLGKYYIINTCDHMYTLIYTPKRSLTRNPLSFPKAPLW